MRPRIPVPFPHNRILFSLFFLTLALPPLSGLTDTIAAQLADARTAEQQGRFEDAIRKYQSILASHGDCPDARLGLGRSFAHLGRCEEATQAFHESASGVPTTEAWEAIIGTCYFNVRRYAPAIPHLERAMRLSRKGKEPALLLSRAYAAQGHYDKATELLRSWLAQNGDDVDILYWIGKFYEESAESAFERLAAANPNSYLIYQLQAEQDITKKAYGKATEALERALAAAPNAPGLHYWLGRVYWNQRILDKAQEELEKELRSNPYHAQANYLLGDVLVTQREPDKAIPFLERAVAMNPGIWDAHRALGRALVMQNRIEEGIREFRIVADANPRDDTIHGLLSNAYRRLGNNAMAQEEGRIYQKLNAERRERVPKPVIDNSSSAESQP